MKKIFLISLMIIMGITATAQQKKSLNSYISYATFNMPGDNATPYVETYITFDKGSLVYVKNASGQYNATVDVTIMFKQGESVKNFGKYSLSSPSVADTTGIGGFFMDVQRYSLENGNYTLEVVLEDENNKTDKPLKVEDQLLMDFPNKFCFSSIIGLESYSKAEGEGNNIKNGFNLVPMIMPYYPENVNKLSFYAEIYNAKKA